MAIPFLTYGDAVDHLLNSIGGATGEPNLYKARSAVAHAYRLFPTLTEWNYNIKRGLIIADAPYETGTITYTASTRTVTLAGGTWPSWALNGQIRIDDIEYQVESQSGLDLILTEGVAPDANIAAGTSYVLTRDHYKLPDDFGQIYQPRNATDNNPTWPMFVSPSDWMSGNRTNENSNTPRRFTVFGDPDNTGAMVMAFDPPPSTTYAHEFLYVRRPAPLKVREYSTGTVSVTAGAKAVTVGSGSPSWTSSHVGCILRFGDATNVPTGYEGEFPFEEEAVIAAVPTSTAITLKTDAVNTFAAVKYTISSYVDIERESMANCFLMLCEYRLAILNNSSRSEIPMRKRVFTDALLDAMAADNRFLQQANTQSGYIPLRSGSDYVSA